MSNIHAIVHGGIKRKVSSTGVIELSSVTLDKFKFIILHEIKKKIRNILNSHSNRGNNV